MTVVNQGEVTAAQSRGSTEFMLNRPKQGSGFRAQNVLGESPGLAPDDLPIGLSQKSWGNLFEQGVSGVTDQHCFLARQLLDGRGAVVLGRGAERVVTSADRVLAEETPSLADSTVLTNQFWITPAPFADPFADTHTVRGGLADGDAVIPRAVQLDR